MRTYFLYDGSQPVCEYDGSGTRTALNTFGADGLVSRLDSSGNTFYTFDERGNVCQRVPPVASSPGGPQTSGVQTSSSQINGAAPARIGFPAPPPPVSEVYDAYGVRTGTAAQAGPFGYEGQAGYYTDLETGLILCTHRFYDPQNGRWLTRDPMGYDGGVNLYGYVTNNPSNRVDPLGLWPEHAPTLTDPEGEQGGEEGEPEPFRPPTIGAIPGGGFKEGALSQGDQTPEDLYAFQSRKDGSQPQAPRPGIDVEVGGNGDVLPQTFDPGNGVYGKGVSLTNNPLGTPLSGNYFRIPIGTTLPSGINIIQDGNDAYPGSPRGPGHFSAFPGFPMSPNEFTNLYRSLFEPFPCGSK